MGLRLDFDYLHHYDAGKSGISVPVKLILGSEVIELDAKLDCGSTFCVFERRWGEVLGFDIETGQPERIGTVMGAFLTYGHWVTLSFFDYEFEIMAFFAAAESFNRNVLGRHGFLDRLVCGLNDYKGRLYLRRPDDDGD